MGASFFRKKLQFPIDQKVKTSNDWRYNCPRQHYPQATLNQDVKELKVMTLPMLILLPTNSGFKFELPVNNDLKPCSLHNLKTNVNVNGSLFLPGVPVKNRSGILKCKIQKNFSRSCNICSVVKEKCQNFANLFSGRPSQFNFCCLVASKFNSISAV